MTVLTVTPARTLGDLKARIADELARSDLTSQIALAIDDAIDIASGHRFWFTEVRDLTFVLTPGQAYYSDPELDALTEIDNLYLLVGGQRRNLRLAANGRLDALADGNPSTGEPYLYSRSGGLLRLYPLPDQAYTLIVDGSSKGLPMANDADSSVWTTYGEKYIRALAKRELYAHVIHNEDKAMVQDQLAVRYRDDLDLQTEGRVMTGEMACNG